MIFFFIHRFNDIDHLVPIIYRLAKDGNYNILVLSLNPYYDISNDFRLNYLKDKLNVKIKYIYKAFYPSIFHRLFSYYFCTDTSKYIFYLLLMLTRKSKGFKRLIFNTIYGRKWCNRLFDEYKPHVLVLDGTAAVSKVYNVSAIEFVSNERSIPKISLPHGVPLFTKHPKGYDKAKADLAKNDCDIIVSASKRWMNECLDFGASPDKLNVIGVARHCKEWEDVLQDIVPWDESLNNTGKDKLKVVYMDMGPDRYDEYKPIAEETLRKINSLDFVHLLFKPHTRSNTANLALPDNVENVRSINSHNLIKWADVVIGMSSSIILGVLMQNKVYISPTYFRQIEMVYEEHGACWMVDSIGELENALITLKKDPSFKPYTQKSIDNFLTEIVYAGEKDKDVLGCYKELILSLLNNKNISARFLIN